MSGLWLLRLVPGQGGDEIAEMHGGLYSGVLAPELKPDIPYSPHMAIVGSKTQDDCLTAQLEFLDGDAVTTGSIDPLDAVGYDGSRMTRAD